MAYDKQNKIMFNDGDTKIVTILNATNPKDGDGWILLKAMDGGEEKVFFLTKDGTEGEKLAFAVARNGLVGIQAKGKGKFQKLFFVDAGGAQVATLPVAPVIAAPSPVTAGPALPDKDQGIKWGNAKTCAAQIVAAMITAGHIEKGGNVTGAFEVLTKAIFNIEKI